MPEGSDEKKTELEALRETIQLLIKDVESTFGGEERSLCERHGWTFPNFGKKEVLDECRSVLVFIDSHKFEGDGADDVFADCRGRLEKWRKDSLRYLYDGNYGAKVFVNFFMTISYVKKSLTDLSPEFDSRTLQTQANGIKKRINALTTRITDCETKTTGIEAAVSRIVAADAAAQALPETLVSLQEAEKVASGAKDRAQEDCKEISLLREKAETCDTYLQTVSQRATKILEKCETALASSTSAGLARSFDDRKKELQNIGYFWTGGLVLALMAAVGCIVWRADQIFALMDKGASVGGFVLFANFVVSIAFVGAPIWLAWVATKQIGYYFRLSEDYAFKATVSASYEGFRREAENQGDEEFTKKVLASTLDRYDEAPLRFVDTRVSGSPYQELIESPIVSKFLKTGPDAVRAIQEFAQERLEKAVGKTAEKVADTVEKAVAEK